ncbi:hypothetical protein PANO111632_02570 [Paracoccus nototheniae]|uniref:Uncharacterized protein n=1 Tax=Paracoccus nototheniae TaxID=2489002 RepID=A0ABW4DV49_9RHOB|nr:hypothetical protein [Paracoccus nototheniae]
MATIPYKPGTPGPLALRLVDDFGIPITADRAQLRIGTGDICLPLDADGPGPVFEFALNEVEIAPSFYSAEVYFDLDDGEGWQLAKRFYLHIKRGC